MCVFLLKSMVQTFYKEDTIMDSTQFMGMLIAAIVVLLGGVGTIVTIIIKPVITLNKTIAKLDISIETLSNDYAQLKNRVDRHGERLDSHETRISHMEGGSKK